MRGGSRVRTLLELRVSIVFLIAVGLLPVIVEVPYWRGVLIVAMYLSLIAAAWNLLAGYSGQFSLAPAAFAMIGGYGSGLLCYHFGTSPWIGIPAGILLAGLIGFCLGRIVLRLRGPYLALTTLSFSEIMRLIIANEYNITRGDLGLSVPPLFESQLVYYYVFLVVLGAVQLGLFFLIRSRSGLYLQSIRDDDVAALGRGVNVVFWKTVAFIISSAICGLAGALYIHFIRLASPELGLILQTGLVICMVVIGGMGTLIGPLIGAFLVQISSEMVRDVGLSHMLVFALIVILIGRFFREGLWGVVKRVMEKRAPVAEPLPAASSGQAK